MVSINVFYLRPVSRFLNNILPLPRLLVLSVNLGTGTDHRKFKKKIHINNNDKSPFSLICCFDNREDFTRLDHKFKFLIQVLDCHFLDS